MADLFDALTDQLNTLVSAEISAKSLWTAVPGGLDKVSASAMGFAWGIGDNKVWICQIPCGGDWKQVAIPDASSITDITTDDLNVYVLYQTSAPTLQLATKTASNVDDWVVVKVPTGIQKIVSTASYIWGQSGSQKYKLPKPGTTGNWIPVSDSLNIKVTSASSTSLYGVDASGVAMKTDESLQTGWSAIPEFKGSKVSAIIGDADKSTLYGLDTSNHLQRCLDGKCTPDTTQGYTPQNLTIEPVSKQLWLTTTSPGESGNIFTKANNDYSGILQATQPIDKQRDEVVQNAEQEYTHGTYATMMSKQLTTVKKILEKTFNISPTAKSTNDNASARAHATLNHTDLEILQMQDSMALLKNILLLVLATVAIYIFGSFLGTFIHFLAFAVLVGGTVYFLQHKQ